MIQKRIHSYHRARLGQRLAVRDGSPLQHLKITYGTESYEIKMTCIKMLLLMLNSSLVAAMFLFQLSTHHKIYIMICHLIFVTAPT